MPLSDEAIFQRAARFRADRSVTDAHLDDVHHYIRPDSEGFFGTDIAGEKTRHKVLDNTAEQDSELLAASLHGMATSPAFRWFNYRALRDSVNRDREAKIWLEDTGRRVNKVYSSHLSNFRGQAHKAYSDVSSYGTLGMFQAEGKMGLPVFQTRPLAELYPAENSDGTIDTVYRWFKMTARQAVQEFGKNAGENVTKAFNDPKQQEQTFEFIHAVYPRSDAIPGRIDAGNLPFASVWLNVAEKVRTKESGFHEMPFHVARWQSRAGEVFGRGPGIKALPDVKMLQRSMKSTIRAQEKSINPSLQVADDGVTGDIIMSDGAINMVRPELLFRGGEAIKPILTGARPDLGEEFMESIRQRIHDAFFRTLLSVTRDPRMTATQFLEVLEETLRIFSPFLGNLHSEWLAPMLFRTLNMLERRQLLLPRPDILVGEDLEIEFISPIAKAQRLVEARGVAQTIEIMLPFGNIDPSMFDIQDIDETYRHVADLVGQPKHLLRSPDAVAAIRAQRQEAQRLDQIKQDVVDLANAAGQAAPALQNMETLGNA